MSFFFKRPCYPNLISSWWGVSHSCEQRPVPCSLPSFWPLPYSAPFRELGLSVFCYSTCWPPRVSLPPGCLGAVVKSEGLERTPPLLGLLSFCQLNRAWLAHLAMHGLSRDLDLLPAWVPEGEGLGTLLVGCRSFPVSCRKCQRQERWDESCPGPGGSEGRERLAGARRLEKIGLFGRNSSSYSLWAGV